MKTLSHYTKFCTLFNIVQTDRIELKGSYFKKFSIDDYEWVRDSAEAVIKEICEEKDWFYDPDYLKCKPYIVSFCSNPNSEYMWDKYGDTHKGIRLVFDREIMESVTLQNDQVDMFVPCTYVDGKESLKQQLLKLTGSDFLSDWPEDDRLIYLATGIKRKKDFENEEENRYVNVYKTIFECKYNDGAPIFFDSNVEEKDWEKLFPFPHEALVGVEVGKNVRQECYSAARDYMKRCGYSPTIIQKEG